MIDKKNSKFNFSLLKLMELSNFSLLKTEKFKQKNLKYLNSFTKIYSNENTFSFFMLDFLQLIKSLKQYIRLIKFLSLKKKKHIYLCSEFNNFFFIKLLLNKLILTKYTTLQAEKQSKVSFVKIKKDHVDYSKFLILLNLSLNSNKNNLDKLVSNNLFLITEINSNLKTKNDNLYKIFNETSDFKKLIFLLLLLEKHFKN
jgi:hypothetical protein